MYKIGELSKLCNISVKTLRYYDSEGLLVPDRIDKFTGYRYYSASKLVNCYRIIALKELAANTVGVNNSIFDVELNSLLTLYKTLVTEINTLEKEINLLIEEVHPHYLSVPGIGSISAAIIYSEYGDISNFDNPGQMLAFAGIEPGINESGTESHGGRMVKRGSSQLRYALINCCLPLIRFDMTFATYYAKKRAEGKPHRVAITHVAKKLIRVIYALERQNTDFCVQKLR